MPLDPVVNFFRSQIATLPLASGGATMVITTGDGNKLPNPATDGAFNLVIYNANDPFVTPEIVRVTAKSGDTLTITRAQEGTTATNKTAGNTWFVELVNTAKMIQNIDTNKVEKTGDTMTGTLTATKLIPSGNVVAGNGMYLPAANEVAISTNGSERLRINSTGAVTAGGTVTAGKLVPTANTVTGNGMYLPTTNVLAFSTNGAERVRVDASGNVGIGTNPPSGALSAGTSPQINIGASFSIFGLTASSNRQANLACNAYYDTGDIFKYANTDPATAYRQLTGVHAWFTAPSGTAGTTVTFTERMRITNTGNVGIGTTSPATKLHVNETSSGTNVEARLSGTGSYSSILTLSGTNSFLIADNNLRFSVGGSERARITDTGNIGIGTIDQFGSGAKVIGIANATTVPTTNPTGGGVLYVEGGALKFRGSSGTVTTIANA
jgi:hypothetical protein